jgi:Lrp/AsnC family transcriptional regulator, leucine-responsive regulatory protein
MDDINRAILTALEENARLTYAELARKVPLSPAAIAERVKRLEEEGVINGYHARVNPAKLGIEVRSFVFLTTTRERFTKVIALARATPEVKEVHHTSGPFSFVIRVIARSEEELGQIAGKFAEHGTVEFERIVSTPVEKYTT